MRDGFRHAIEAGATGLGVTNLKNLSYLTEIFPSPPKELVVQPWRPRALLFFPYETFYSYRGGGVTRKGTTCCKSKCTTRT